MKTQEELTAIVRDYFSEMGEISMSKYMKAA